MTPVSLNLPDGSNKITSFEAVYCTVSAKMFKLFLTTEYTYAAVIGIKKDLYTIYYPGLVSLPDYNDVNLVK